MARSPRPAGRWTAARLRPDMWVDAAEDPRAGGEPVRGERATLTGYLRAYRLTLEMKCADLDAEALARRSVPPSTISLLGLIRHLADVERFWFRQVMAGTDAPRRFRTPDRPEGQWDGALPDAAVVSEAWEAWREEVEFADRFMAGEPDLGLLGRTSDGERLELREVLVHLIEEYARHCGHADLLRERIDGRVGQ